VIGKRERGGVSKQPGPPSTTPFFLLNLHIFHLDHLLLFSRLFSSMSFTSLPVRRRLLHSSSSRSWRFRGINYNQTNYYGIVQVFPGVHDHV
jgi:hypothetical protein